MPHKEKLPIDAEYVRHRLDYDCETGRFTWRDAPGVTMKWRRKWAGKPAGSKTRYGYLQITIAGHRYYAHRLAWAHAYGDISPELQIDHINGDRFDNRLANLRLVTAAINSSNMPPRSKLGLPKGVSLHKRSGRYLVLIRFGGVRRSLGYFTDAIEAGVAYKTEFERLHGIPCR